MKLITNWIRLTGLIFRKRLVRPISRSFSPINDLALGIAVGLFWAFTPLVGIQMYMVFLTWLGSKFLFRTDFDIIVGMALVWISNPLTMVFMYYSFYIVGYFFLNAVNVDVVLVTFQSFKDTLGSMLNQPYPDEWQRILAITDYLLVELCVPMIIGSIFFAIPIAFGSFFLSRSLIEKRRRIKARDKGIHYDEWRKMYEKKAQFSFFGSKTKSKI